MSTKITNCFIVKGLNGEIVIDTSDDYGEFNHNVVYTEWYWREKLHAILDTWIDGQIVEQYKTTPTTGIRLTRQLSGPRLRIQS